MKVSQQLYESLDTNNLFLRFNQSQAHQRKLSEIKKRKNPFIDDRAHSQRSPLRNSKEKITSFDLNDSYAIKLHNKIFLSRLDKIQHKQVKPTLNDEFLVLDKINKKVNDKMRKLKELRLKEQNDYLYKRLKEKQPFIKAKELDSLFHIQHGRQVNNLRKVKTKTHQSKSQTKEELLLPKIN